MTFQQQIQVIPEDILKTLTSEDGLLIAFSIREYPENFFKGQSAVIRFINNLPLEERLALKEKETVIYMHKVCPKNTVYGEQDYDGICGEILETTEFLQYDKHKKVWR